MATADVQPHVNYAGAVTALTFWNLKHITIEESFVRIVRQKTHYSDNVVLRTLSALKDNMLVAIGSK